MCSCRQTRLVGSLRPAENEVTLVGSLRHAIRRFKHCSIVRMDEAVTCQMQVVRPLALPHLLGVLFEDDTASVVDPEELDW